MRWLSILLICILSVTALAQAQQDSPGYVIRDINREFTPDNRELRVQFDVLNLSSADSSALTVSLVDTASNTILAQQEVRALNINERATVPFIVPTSALQPGPQNLRIVLAAGDQQLAFASVGVTVPEVAATPAATVTPTPGPAGSFEILSVTVDLANPLHVLGLAGIVLAALLLLVVLILLIRVILHREPRLTGWQPPYISTPQVDPSSQTARRQGWQVHAQNDLPPPSTGSEGAVHIRKLVANVEGLDDWRIKGIRLVLYDQYGRVHRTETAIGSRYLRRLNRAAQLTPGEPAEQTLKRVRPAAKALVNHFRGKLTNRSAMLPVAMDIRLQGKQGDVHIMMELFMFQQGHWQLLDRWEPEVMVPTGLIEENLTYSLYGMRSEETMRAFTQRLQTDVARTLAQLLNKKPQSEQKAT
ncbi:MAG: hypothetical protein K8L99_33465 [Anaerolineae bacterium]|nr:hypothetical protein [Anaerolineae bacterium]